ncbi:Phosphoglycerate mutase-like protein [Hondaea fermentalgiana]|uniref:Phosphoglycerate mutase-like protein n=1 Tax=Hondaea fermentalgiana TaxID=2315210 RepID=A0A2R5GQD4_9STRA|nr:Phosphoglycerate mutase-like protein [Hondaea fermentalgiana]|eukprot:GBG33086.1 Phosphoglycerate mutase-like protein [Hondaea fermentalgiana]
MPRERSDQSSGWSKSSLLGAAAVVALAAIGVALVASGKSQEFGVTSKHSNNGTSKTTSSSTSSTSANPKGASSGNGSASGRKESSQSEEKHGGDETLKKLSKLYHESRNEDPQVEIVRQRTVELNSKDIQRLGLAPNSSWKDFNKDVDEITAKDESAKVVYMIRHGEGDHNAAEREYGTEKWENEIAKTDEYLDACLNEVGRDQAQKLQEAFAQARKDGLKVDAIIVSPLTRAIETAKIGLGDDWDKLPIYAVEMCRERFGKNMCDKRRSVAELKEKFPEINFDYFMESEEDPWFTPIREADDHIEKRIAYFFNWLAQTPWKHVVVAGHSSYMAHTTKVLKAPYHWPANCELVPVTIHKKDAQH